MKKIRASLNLCSIQLAAPREMNACAGDLFTNDPRIAPMLVEVLHVGKRRAHGGANEERWLLFRQECFSLGCMFSN